MKRKRTAATAAKSQSAHPYKAYETHPCWKRVNKAISELVENEDLMLQTARHYVVGYICKTLLKPQTSSGRK